MPRKYSVEFKEKAVHQIIEMVRLESCSLQHAYTEVGSCLEYLTTRCGLGTVTALQYAIILTLQAAKQWKKNSGVCVEKTAN